MGHEKLEDDMVKVPPTAGRLWISGQIQASGAIRPSADPLATVKPPGLRVAGLYVLPVVRMRPRLPQRIVPNRQRCDGHLGEWRRMLADGEHRLLAHVQERLSAGNI